MAMDGTSHFTRGEAGSAAAPGECESIERRAANHDRRIEGSLTREVLSQNVDDEDAEGGRAQEIDIALVVIR